mmetsp:Transcript_45465/g.120601  ORF Transcript_45465/g.120601 Transcript_45465/m.120601 type:complete len:137 (-) Transcript_45465:324-734(-)
MPVTFKQPVVCSVARSRASASFTFTQQRQQNEQRQASHQCGRSPPSLVVMSVDVRTTHVRMGLIPGIALSRTAIQKSSTPVAWNVRPNREGPQHNASQQLAVQHAEQVALTGFCSICDVDWDVGASNFWYFFTTKK